MRRLLLALALVAVCATPALAQTLTLDKPSYTVGDRIVVSFTGAAGTSYDYVGLFPANAPTTNPWPGPILDWDYCPSKTQTPGEPGTTSGSITFTIALQAGSYEARFFANDSLTATARVAFTVAVAQQAPTPVVLVGPNSILDWPQVAPDLATAQGYTYTMLADGASTGTVLAVTCTGTASPFDCGTPFPAFAPGQHSIAVTAANANGVSAPSPALVFQVQVLVPAPPGQLGVKP